MIYNLKDVEINKYNGKWMGIDLGLNNLAACTTENSAFIIDGKPLKSALYGYIVLLNGTICPDDGEYVSEFAAIRESIILKAKRHEIETLYLPLEVASQLFSIFEILNDAYTNDELLKSVIRNLSPNQRQDLKELINNDANYEFLFRY